MGVVPFVRLHVDDEGGSHIQAEHVALASAEFAPPAPPMEVSAPVAAIGIRFLHLPPRWVGDWHPTPQRIWIRRVAGAMRFEATDGAVHRLWPEA